MIDTNKLRRLAQAAMHPVTKGRWMRLFGERTVYDRMEDGCRGIPVVSTDKHPPSSFEAACLDFIAAANPAAVSEILDRLEAAESDGLEQARLLGMSGEREAALLSKLEAAEKERDDFAQQLVQSEVGKREISEAHDALQVEVGKLKDLEVSRCVKINGYIVDNARLAEEVVRLQAKIAEMEKQEPVAEWIENRFHQYPQLVWNEKYRVDIGDKLYALPGAQNVPEKLCYDSRWEISIDYVDGWNAAIDAVRGKSPSWYCPDCCIVFPFGEPKSCPHDDARCNRALAAAPEVEGK